MSELVIVNIHMPQFFCSFIVSLVTRFIVWRLLQSILIVLSGRVMPSCILGNSCVSRDTGSGLDGRVVRYEVVRS
jgi:hypothetical protein